ncbi:hypothetical protein NLG97_g10531 [Lecanicillium saksenae]|uniref:Uncharacterized protein n=1 Tax=Lecanicillium saksenae TaxID=468837 RepID=A0ACC1QDF1_9HYPO|nr:hypothetical protein NLG97_g10531 [Lecanicillium saksenae]
MAADADSIQSKIFCIVIHCPREEFTNEGARSFLEAQEQVMKFNSGNPIMAVSPQITQEFKTYSDPLQNQLEQLAEVPSNSPTLQDRYISASYEARGVFKNGACTFEKFTKSNDKHQSYLYHDFNARNDVPRRKQDSLFPFWAPTDFRIVGNPEQSLHNKVTKVFAHDKTYAYKDVRKVFNNVTNDEIKRYSRIRNAGFGPEVRVTKLAGMVVDGRRTGHPRFLGLALDDFGEMNRLDSPKSRVSNMSTAMRLKIGRQLCETLQALHERGIV